MKLKSVIVLLFVLTMQLNYSTLHSQPRRLKKEMTDNRQFVNYWLTTPVTQDTVEYVHYAKISNDFLQFVFKDSIYQARYELSLQIISDDNEIVTGQIVRKSVTAKSFQETNNIHQYTFETIRLFVPAGEFKVYLELNDLETKTPYQHEYAIKLPANYKKSIELYGFRYFHENIPVNESLTNIFPTFPAIRSPEDSTFRAGFLLYQQDPQKTVRLKYDIFNKQGINISSDSLIINQTIELQPIVLELTQPFKFGQYRLALDIQNGIDEIKKSSFFFVQWDKHPLSIQSFSDATQAMIYIMLPKEYREMKEKPEAEQKEIFEAYWKKRDPTPATEENELEVEFYNRVALANQKFSSFKEGRQGWKTDRGRIYITYGPPTDYERPTPEPGSMVQYEIWYYRSLHKRFVFIDRYGTNEYRLISEN